MTSATFQIDIHDQQGLLPVDEDRLRTVIEQVLTEEQIPSAEISVALVDDATIHRINDEFLGHDYPTDVISFVLNPANVGPVDDRCAVHLEGELVVSVETALREATTHGWSPADELLLYTVHGMLHLCGYDDLTEEARPIMRQRERQFLACWHLTPVGLEA